ncbi:MAG: hypothetical protein ACREGG_03130 [Candidatus Saccharimonadales bacterium]
MNYYKLRRNGLISDIFSPFNGKGYNVEHPGVQKAPIGALHNRYVRRRAYTSRQASRVAAKDHSYTLVPPLQALHGEISRPRLFTRISRAIKNAGLLLLAILTGIGQGVKSLSGRDRGYHLDEAQPGSSRLKLAVPIILLVIGLIWLLSALPTSNPGRSNPGINAQTIPVTPITLSSSGSGNNSNNGSSSSQVTPGAATTSAPSASSNASSALGAPSGTPTGGMGGVGSTSPGTLPMTLTVPPVNTSADGKQVLDTGGTSITVN